MAKFAANGKEILNEGSHISLGNVFLGHTDTLSDRFVDGAIFVGEKHSHSFNDVLTGDADGDGNHETTSKRDLLNVYDNVYDGHIGNAHPDRHCSIGEKSRCTDTGKNTCVGVYHI